MSMLFPLSFSPVSADATYTLSLQRRPVVTSSRLEWGAIALRDVSLRNKNFPEGSTATLVDLECIIEVTIGEPYDGKESNPAWDHAHGFLRWEGITSYHVALVVPAKTFESLMRLAESGHLPSLEINCISGYGIENDGPYGEMEWDTNGDRTAVPIKDAEFTYHYAVRK